MNERADFYVGRGKNAIWLGSITWNGCPKGLASESEREELPVLGELNITVSTFQNLGGLKTLTATTEKTFREGVQELAASRSDFITPEQGWPWVWPTSALTDYAYAFDTNAVYASHRGSAWFFVNLQRTKGGEPPESVIPSPARVAFPRMIETAKTEHKNKERVR